MLVTYLKHQFITHNYKILTQNLQVIAIINAYHLTNKFFEQNNTNKSFAIYMNI